MTGTGVVAGRPPGPPSVGRATIGGSEPARPRVGPSPVGQPPSARDTVPGAIDAAATIVAERIDISGVATTRVRLRSAPPLVLRRTAPGVVHLVGVGGGPVAGDRLHYRVRVAPGAQLTVRQVAATVALPSPSGDEPSILRVDVEVADGASLDWIGEPTVAARGCHHETDVRFVLAPDASLRWRDELIAGRHREDPGLLRSRLTVSRGNEPILRSETTIGDLHWRSPAVAGGARVLGTELLVGTWADGLADPDGAGQDPGPPGRDPDAPGHVPDASGKDPEAPVHAAIAHLDDGVVLVQALADDHPTVRRLLERAGRADRSSVA